MRANPLSLVGIAFFALAIWRAWRVRRDLARGETQWERALFGRRDPVVHARTPLRFWCAIAANTALVFLLALVAVAAFRGTALIRH